MPKKGYKILCCVFLGMACIFMPFEGETVIKTCSDAITPAGPPICSSSSSKYLITVVITFYDVICINALSCHVDHRAGQAAVIPELSVTAAALLQVCSSASACYRRFCIPLF